MTTLTCVSVLAALAACGIAIRTRSRMRRLAYLLAATRRRACHDPLTGLLNRPGLADTWATAHRTAAMVAVIDLDGFKPVNDTHGHAAGDLVLAETARRIGTVTAVAARLGGDEFAVLLPDTAAADRLAAAIASPIGLPTGATVTVTASIGLAPTSADLGDVLAAADAAMYRAKTTAATVAVYDPHRDDHPTPAIRPEIRVRDLPTLPLTLPTPLGRSA